MALSKIADVRALDGDDIEKQIFSVKRELLELRVKKKLGSLEKPHRFKDLKRKLAQLMTVKTEKEKLDNTPD